MAKRSYPTRQTRVPKAARQKSLSIALPDSGRTAQIKPEMFGVVSRDKSWNPFIDSFIRANQTNFSALGVELEYTHSHDDIDLALRGCGIIGAVPLRAPDTHKIVGGLTVYPRFGWDSVGGMMSEIGWLAAPEFLNLPIVPGSAVNIPPWVVAGPLLSRLEEMLRDCAPKFRPVEAILNSPRGRVDWITYSRKHVAQGRAHELPCTFSDLLTDQTLRSFIKWALFTLQSSLSPSIADDSVSFNLWSRIRTLISGLTDVNSVAPKHSDLFDFRKNRWSGSRSLEDGVAALEWILDERGLAGSNNLDGVSWRLTMHELFELWVERLVRSWAKQFGGVVSCGRDLSSRSSIEWRTASHSSLTSLIPDVVVQTKSETYIFDAKYKNFMEPMDEHAWTALKDRFVEDHRHDLHQVIAYSSLYSGDKITACLVYPLKGSADGALGVGQNNHKIGIVGNDGREINVCLLGVPLYLSALQSSGLFETLR